MIPLFCVCAPFAADLLNAVAGNSQLVNAKEIVQLLYNQRIERMHDACGCQGPGGRGLKYRIFFNNFSICLMMDAWNTSYKFLNRDDGSWECMMRESHKGGLVFDKSGGGACLQGIQTPPNLSWRQLDFPNEGGARVQTQWS